MKLQRERNGITFTIDFPAIALIKEISESKEEWVEMFTDVINTQDEATKEYAVKEIDDMIDKINYYASDEKGIEELFEMLPLKKNNKLSKQSKPTLSCLNVGYYVEDCYGWTTREIRVQAIDELNATVILQNTIIHY